MKPLSDWSNAEILAALQAAPPDDLLATWCQTYRPDLWHQFLRTQSDSAKTQPPADKDDST